MFSFLSERHLPGQIEDDARRAEKQFGRGVSERRFAGLHLGRHGALARRRVLSGGVLIERKGFTVVALGNFLVLLIVSGGFEVLRVGILGSTSRTGSLRRRNHGSPFKADMARIVHFSALVDLQGIIGSAGKAVIGNEGKRSAPGVIRQDLHVSQVVGGSFAKGDGGRLYNFLISLCTW